MEVQTEVIQDNKHPKLTILKKDQPVVLFDGVCNLCNGAVDFIIRHDKEANIMFASLQSQAGQQLLQQHRLPTQDFNSMVLLKEGKVYQRSSAALNIAAEMGGFWPAFKVFVLVPSFLRDAVYNFIAQNRYRFWGKKESCRLPTAAERSRFLG